MIKVRGLNKYYGSEKILKDISFTINGGEIFGLVGLSGAGKSTLLRCMGGLEKFEEGEIS